MSTSPSSRLTARPLFHRKALNFLLRFLHLTLRMLLRATLPRMSKASGFAMATARQNQTFVLPDGRTLGYAEYGSTNGHPLLYFHGYPSSRLEASPIDDIASRHSIRVLALDRPGFGLSSPQPHRCILDWPADVQAFAQVMGIARFTVFGVSGGGPFALACAHAFPSHVLTGVGLFATAPPWAAGAQHMALYRRLMSVAANHWPSGLRVTMGASVGMVRWLMTLRPVTRSIDRWLEAQRRKDECEPGAALVEDGVSNRTTVQRREDLLRMLIDEPFAQMLRQPFTRRDCCRHPTGDSDSRMLSTMWSEYGMEQMTKIPPWPRFVTWQRGCLILSYMNLRVTLITPCLNTLKEHCRSSLRTRRKGKISKLYDRPQFPG